MIALMAVCAMTAQAQDEAAQPMPAFTAFATEMQAIARNNTELKALHSHTQATRMANRQELALPSPEAEVAYMFGSPKGVPARTNVNVTQTLDWGVLTGRRRRMAQADNTMADAQYHAAFQRVMAQADALLVRMVACNKMCHEMEARHRQAQQIRAMYEKRYSDGDINAIELNKVRLNEAVSQAALQRARADRQDVARQLAALNGGQDLGVADTLYPATPALPPLSELAQALPASAAVQQAQAAVAQSDQAIRLARVEAMPELTVGFQGEYIKNNNYSGPSLGLSIPLWGNARRKVKAAQTEKTARQLDLKATEQQQQGTLERLYRQATDLRTVADRLNADLQATASEALLRRALDAGQLSLLSYLLEQSFYYEARTAWLEAERDAQIAASELRSLLY